MKVTAPHHHPSSRTEKVSFKLLADISGLLHSVTLLAHLTGDTIVHGSTTCLRAPPEPADCKYQGEGSPPQHGEQGAFKSLCRLASAALTEACKQYGRETLTYLSFLEEEGIVENADSTAMRSCLARITAIGEVSSVLSLGKSFFGMSAGDFFRDQ